MSNARFHRCRNGLLPKAWGRVGERPSIPLRTWLLTGVAAFVLLDPTLASADPVGTAGAANVRSSGTPPGESMRVIEMGARVVSDEKIDTSPSGSVQLVFIDKTTLDIGPNSSIVIDKFVYDPQAARGEMAVSLGKGVLRVVGGQATHTGGATISTPFATIGLRGGILLVSQSSKEGTQAILGYGVMTMSAGGVTHTVDLPGFALRAISSIAPPSTAFKAPAGLIATYNAAVTSKTGQSGGSNVKPSDSQAAANGISTNLPIWDWSSLGLDDFLNEIERGLQKLAVIPQEAPQPEVVAASPPPPPAPPPPPPPPPRPPPPPPPPAPPPPPPPPPPPRAEHHHHHFHDRDDDDRFARDRDDHVRFPRETDTRHGRDRDNSLFSRHTRDDAHLPPTGSGHPLPTSDDDKGKRHAWNLHAGPPTNPPRPNVLASLSQRGEYVRWGDWSKSGMSPGNPPGRLDPSSYRDGPTLDPERLKRVHDHLGLSGGLGNAWMWQHHHHGLPDHDHLRGNPSFLTGKPSFLTGKPSFVTRQVLNLNRMNFLGSGVFSIPRK